MAFNFQAVKVGVSTCPPRILLIGVEGVGKSTFGAQCEKPIFLCSEDGLVGDAFTNTHHYTPSSWEDAVDFLNALTTSKHDYKTLVVDTIDWLEPILFAGVCKKHSTTQSPKASIEDFGYGKGFTIAAEEFRRAIAAMEAANKAGMTIVVNSHCQVRTFANPSGDNYDRYEPKGNKIILGLLKEWVDEIFFATFEVFTSKKNKNDAKSKATGGQRRVVYTENSASYVAKNRHPGLLPVMPLDAVEIFAALKAGETATPETLIAEINALIPSVPEAKRKAVTDYVAANAKDMMKLKFTLNRVRALAQEGEGENG